MINTAAHREEEEAYLVRLLDIMDENLAGIRVELGIYTKITNNGPKILNLGHIKMISVDKTL